MRDARETLNYLSNKVKQLACEIKELQDSGSIGIEVDPVFVASSAFDITTEDVTFIQSKDYGSLNNLPDLSLKADLVGGIVPASQLPSYVDDVLEFDTLIDFPTVGEEGKIYITKDTNSIYRWSGTIYVDITQENDTLASVTSRGNETIYSMKSFSDIEGATLSVTSTIDDSQKVSFKSDNVFSGYDIQLPDWSGTATMMIEENMSIYVQGETGQVGVFVGNRNIRSFSGLLYDFINNRLAVGTTSPTTALDVTTFRARNLPIGDATYTKLAVAKSDGTFGLIDKPIFQNIPTDFFISGNVNGSNLTYKTDSYRQVDLAVLAPTAGFISNINEIIRIGNDFFIVINYGINTNQNLIALRDCYIENNIFKSTSVEFVDTTFFGASDAIHSLAYNDTDGMLYVASRKYSIPFPTGAVKIVKIDPGSLKVIGSLTFPNNVIYQNSTTDIKIFNNKLYITAGAGANFRVVELSTNLQDYSEIYSGTSDITLTHIANTAFEIYNGKMYLTCYDATAGVDLNTNIRVVELDLITRSIRTSNKIILTSTVGASIQAHWLTVYNDKILATVLSNGVTFYYTALVRIDIKSLTKDDELVLDMPVTDDNSILDGYLYLNGESFTSVQPDYPKDNAKLLRVNPMNFADLTTEIAVFNAGKGSYGSLNYNAKSVIQLNDIRNSFFEAKEFFDSFSGTIITLANTPKTNSIVNVIEGGIILREGATRDYTISGTTITFTSTRTNVDVEINYTY